MSDSIKDIARHYRKNLYPEHPQSIGLFTIPEYPELEAQGGMWSAALEALLTTLRYLAPATLLTIFWGQQSFLFRILKHIDYAFRSIVFSSEEQKEEVLQWLTEAGSVEVDQLEAVWRHGWILCGVLDAALPGACAGHPPTKLTLDHAQAIAHHYLAVEPVFSRHELESNDTLSKHQEWKLVAYLDHIRQALAKLTQPVLKPTIQRTSLEAPAIHNTTLDYAAKGSGLSAAQVNHRAFFKIYPTSQQTMEPGELTILIRGPKDTYGMAVIPPILGKAQTIRQKLMGLQSKQNYTENILPITQGATYMRSYGKNNMNKTYYIPKSKYDIDIDVQLRSDHGKICYTVNKEGNYEVSITSRGQNIVGSPFSVTVSNNIVDILERDSYCLEDGEEIDIVDVKTDRKVVLRIVDFVTEKMLLRENGALEKISDDEAKILMTTENIDKDKPKINRGSNDINKQEQLKSKCQGAKFNSVAHQVLTMNKVCRAFNNLMTKKYYSSIRKHTCPRNQQDIPDIVNSTLSDVNANQHILLEIRDKYIVPENITVSLTTEKSKLVHEKSDNNNVIQTDTETIKDTETTITDSLHTMHNESHGERMEDTISSGRQTPTSTNNPFLNDMYKDNFLEEKSFGTFVTSEYETNNSQNEETRDSSITIVIDPNMTPSPTQNNPFFDDDFVEFERPKTPIFKIISGEKLNRDESVFIEPKSEYGSGDDLSNAFINPFFTQYHQKINYEEAPVTDFIIGAPVSLPPIIRASSPEPAMRSLVIMDSEHLTKCSDETNVHKTRLDISESLFSTPRTLAIPNNTKVEINTVKSTYHSLDSGDRENLESSNASTSNIQIESHEIVSEQNCTSKRDTWDSAYVSIDDSNSSPDTNNNEHAIISETPGKPKFSDSEIGNGLKHEEVITMGPAERELWQTCSDLNFDKNKTQEEVKPYKWELKRLTCTPIIEESDRSLSSGYKDLSRADIRVKQGESETLSVAFAELNDLYQEYFPNSETTFNAVANEGTGFQSIEALNTQPTDFSVDSASETSDVKRHKHELEGKTSEVQANVTESVSASQTLCNHNNDTNFNQYRDETQFGDNEHNIVLEKKRYWDEKIRQIEAKSAETFVLPKKNRVSSKQIKHNDSLSKRRGKQMIKHFLSSGDYSQVKTSVFNDEKGIEIAPSEDEIKISENGKLEEKLVVKWKKYWDDKLESEHEINDLESIRTKSLSNTNTTNTNNLRVISKAQDEINISTENYGGKETKHQPIKQELPEEVFKAFETSPKRFFGTSRKHILSKIDTFSGKPDIVDSTTTEVSTVCHESGLVSSRISLFHNMSNTEELTWAKRKSQSLHNIYHGKGKIIGPSEYKPRSEQCRSTQPAIFREIDTSKNLKQAHGPHDFKSSLIKDKRATMVNNTNNESFDEIETQKRTTDNSDTIEYSQKLENTRKDINNIISSEATTTEILRKKSFSKSEMDIFSKTSYEPTDDLDTHKSYDVLPKINVKSFITLYESVSKNAEDTKSLKTKYRTTSVDSQKLQQCGSPTSDAVHKVKTPFKAGNRTTSSSSESKHSTPEVTPKKSWTSKESKSVGSASFDTRTSDSMDIEIVSNENDNKHTTYLSLSDIELEIVECSPDISSESSPERITNTAHIDYKSRFKSAKEYFQSLEELREHNTRKPRKLNECEILLRKQSTESLKNERPQRRVKKNIKSHSMPSTEISKIWNQLQQNQESSSNTKLVKISEKFNVDDLFTDVMEGRLSRQGSLRGIPHKKAVLEAFRSMENVSDNAISSYEFAESQMSDFAKEHRVQSAQSYLNEYPYLPTTDPSKYHSRLDEKASGLISYKELLGQRPRRNSVPDLRMNTKFTEDL